MTLTLPAVSCMACPISSAVAILEVGGQHHRRSRDSRRNTQLLEAHAIDAGPLGLIGGGQAGRRFRRHPALAQLTPPHVHDGVAAGHQHPAVQTFGVAGPPLAHRRQQGQQDMLDQVLGGGRITQMAKPVAPDASGVPAAQLALSLASTPVSLTHAATLRQLPPPAGATRLGEQPGEHAVDEGHQVGLGAGVAADGCIQSISPAPGRGCGRHARG